MASIYYDRILVHHLYRYIVLIDLHPQIPPLFLNKYDFIRTVIDKIISRY